MSATNIKRSIVRNGQKTSVSLEKEFWEGLREIARSQNKKLTSLVQQIDLGRNGKNLSSAIRVFVFNNLRARVAAQASLAEVELNDRAAANDRAPSARPTSNTL